MDDYRRQVAARGEGSQRMRSVELGDAGMRSSVLGFGCSAVLGRVGRKASLAALGAALDAGITFFDTARSYGYGESEALLGEFLHGRRASVVISTKFGILPARMNPFKRSLKPIARSLLRLAPAARRAIRSQIAAQFSAGHFSVPALHESLEASLRALRTDYVDLLFMHEAPASALQKDDLFAALERLVDAGKIRRFGIASSAEVIDAALQAVPNGLRSFQFPWNLFDLGMAQRWTQTDSDIVAIANHPFGGVQRVSDAKALLGLLAESSDAPASMREKLSGVDDVVLADAVLNAITRDTGVHVVIPSMMELDHLRANVAAIERSRFSSEELYWLRSAITTRRRQQPGEAL